MTVRARLAAVLACIALLAVAATGLSTWRSAENAPLLSSVHDGAQVVDHDVIPLLLLTKVIKLHVVQVQQWLQDVSATRGLDGLDDGFDEAQQARDDFYADLERAVHLAEELGATDAVSALNAAADAMSPYYESGVRLAQAYVEGGPEAGNRLMGQFDEAAGAMTAAVDELTAIVEAIVEQRLDVLSELVADVQAANADLTRLMAILTVVALAAALAGGAYLLRLIGRSLAGLLADIGVVAAKDGQAALRLDPKRRDEFGAVAKSLAEFRTELLKVDRMAAEQEAMKAQAEADRRRQMHKLADRFEGSVGNIVEGVSSASTEMQSTAESMSAIVEETSVQASSVASAAEQASANVQTVASATEELSSSIAEIARQVQAQTAMAGEAGDAARRSDQQIKSLAEQAQAIGQVVELITSIAEQTNLLALNATIEAARAGDAGKGFAVVASEVKSLANQTAKATEQIAGQIKAIQDQTGSAVDAIDLINGKIRAMSEIAATVAAAVEEQNAATGEIGRNVQEAATGTQQVTDSIVGVNQAAQETGASATQVLSAAGELSQQAAELSSQVKQFVAQIRAG